MPPQKPINLELDGVIEKCKTIKVLWKEGVISPAKISLYISLKLPEDAKPKKGKEPLVIDPAIVKKAKDAAQDRLDQIGKKIEKTLEDMAKLIYDAFMEKPQDFKRAKTALDKANKFIEELLDDAPSEVREAVYSKTKLPADEMSTVNDLTFKNLTIVRGSFETDSADVLEDPPDYSSELKELWSSKNLEKRGKSEQDKSLKKNTIDCILFENDDDTIVLLGFSGSPKSADWKKYMNEKPKEYSGTIEPTLEQFTLKVGGGLSTKKNLLEKALKNQSKLNLKCE